MRAIKDLPVTKKMTIKLAGFIIEIVFHKTENLLLYNKFENYLEHLLNNFTITTKKNADYTIHIIDNVKSSVIARNNFYFINLCEEINKRTIVTYYSISIAQFQIVLKKVLVYLLSISKGFFLHASASLIDKKCVLFLGEEGAGKSTITSLIQSIYPKLADDSAIVGYHEKQFVFYQSPFLEKNEKDFISSKSITLSKVIFLTKASECKMVSLTSKDKILKKVIKHLHAGDNEKSIIKSINSFVLGNNFFYQLYFTKSANELQKILG